MKKKLLTLFAISTLAVCSMLLCISASAVTYTGSCGENVTYSLDTATGVMEISGTGAMTNYESSSDVPWYSNNWYYYIYTVEIADGVTSIGDRAFTYCFYLTSVTISDSVTTIGDYAFRGCDKLTSVTLGGGVTSIGNSAFSSCIGLTSVTIGDSITSIGSNVFDNCDDLTSIEVDENNASFCDIDGVLFSKDKTVIVTYPAGIKNTTYLIPDSVTSIGDNAFANCSGLTSVTIPDSVTSIGDSAFSACTGLTSLTIPDSVTSIGNSAFYYCTGLTSVTIPGNVETVGVRAFSDCSSLKRATINASVVGDYAFSSCSSLVSVTILANVSSIGSGVFSSCSSLEGITVVNTNTNYKTVDGILFNMDMTVLIQCPAKTSLTEYSIPNSVTSIDSYAFNYCDSLTSIMIPDSVTSIGSYEFSLCSNLTSIYVIRGSYGETWAKENYPSKVKYGVSLDTTVKVIEKGITFTLTATVDSGYTGDKTVTWTSSNEAVATVKNGVVSAVSEGTAVIKAEIPGGHYATCDVTVTDFSKIADRFLKFEGYQLRESGYNGLRSGFVVDFDGLYAIEEEGYTVLEYGTILAATEKLTKNGDDLTVFAGSDGSYGTLSYAKLFTIYKNYSYVGKYVSFDENELVYYCTVTHFNAETYDKEVTIRGYAVIADSEGNEYVVYADYQNEAYRSVSLMQMCLEMKAKGLIDPLTCISYLDVEKFMNASGKYGDQEVEEDDFFG